MDSVKRSLLLALLITFSFMLLEGIGGFIAGSLAMLGDAAHMMTDAASFAVSLVAVYLAEKGVTRTMTFGHGRIEVLAALYSTLAIWLVTGLLVGEAISRIRAYLRNEAEPVSGKIMTILGTIGVFMNVILERILGGHDHAEGHSHSHGHSHGHAAPVNNNKFKSQELVRSSHSHHDSSVEEGHAHNHDSHQIDDHEHHSHDHSQNSHVSDHSHDHSDHDSNHDSEQHSPHSSTSGGHSHDHHSERTRLTAGASDGGSYAAVATHEHEDHHPGSSPWLLQSANLNLDAAYLHVLGDLIQSVGVVVAGITIWIRPDLQIADPLCTLFFAVLVLVTTFSMLKQTVLLLLQGAPARMNVQALQASLSKIDGVCDVHDIHVWEITPGRAILTVHIGIYPDSLRTSDEVLDDAHKIAEATGIEYSTIQVQKMYDGKCAAAACFSSGEVGSPTHADSATNRQDFV